MEQVTINLVGKTRTERLKGREYLVAPLSLLVPGVLNGSAGALYYPPEEVSKDPSSWNHVPIVVYHPKLNGHNVSARDPHVLNSQGIGLVMRAKTDNGRLVAEGWFDVESTRNVDNRILTALQAGKPIELSTGLFTENEPAEEGAVHNGKPYQFIARNYRPDHLAILPDEQGACSVADGCGVLVNEEVRDRLDVLLESHKPDVQEESEMAQTESSPLVDEVIANCECWSESEEDRSVLNQLSEDRLRGWIDFAKKSDSSELVANAAREGFDDQAGNSHVFNEGTGEWTSQIKETPVDNTDSPEPQPQTADEWMASAPAEVQSAVRNAMDIETREKVALVEKMTSNISDDQKTDVIEVLSAKPLDELRTLSALTPHEEKPATNSVLNYFGASAPSTNLEEDTSDDVLPLPTMSYSD